MEHVDPAMMWHGKARVQMKLEHWPVSDRNAWQAAITRADLLDEGGAAADWAPATRMTVMKAYGTWLNWLKARNILIQSASPLERIQRCRIAEYVSDLRATRASNTVWNYLQGLAMMIDAIAPGADTAWLWRVVCVLQKAVEPTDRKHGRIIPSSELITFGEELMNAAEQALDKPALQRAASFRDGFMIALLAARPLRIKNFAAIELGRHLIARGSGHALHFDATEVKNRKSISTAIPECLTAPLEKFLQLFRQILLDEHGRNGTSARMMPAGAALWVTSWGTRMCEGTLRSRICAATRARFGHSVNPHLFRDCAATSIASEDPANLAITMKVLGHVDLPVSERHYNHATSTRAAALYQTEIEAMRKGRETRHRAGTRQFVIDGNRTSWPRRDELV